MGSDSHQQPTARDPDPDTPATGAAAESADDRSTVTRIVDYVFGDSVGLLLFTGVFVVYLLTWRIGFFINDNYTLANTLVAVADGHLAVEQAVYGNEGLQSPGMFRLDGAAYGRNYGQLILALPFLWVIQAVAEIAELRVVIAATWGGLVIAVAWLTADTVRGGMDAPIDVEAALLYGGSVLALGGFLLATVGAPPIDPVQHHLMALQLQAMVAAAFIGVVTYRLLTRISNRRVGLAAAVGIALSAPIGFWSSVPKRHVFVALSVMVAAYFLYRSREASQRTSQPRRTLTIGDRTVSATDSTLFRALTYVPVGLLAWVNAGEGMLLLLVVLSVDIPTGSRDVRSLLAVATAGVASAVPMLVTNYLISGNPFLPPQVIQRDADVGPSTGSGSGSGSGSGGSPGGQGGGEPSTGESPVGSLLDIAVDAVSVIVRRAGAGFSAIMNDPERFVPLLVRSNYEHSIAYKASNEIIRLSVLESLPVAAALLVLPVLLWRRDVSSHVRAAVNRGALTPVRTVDAFLFVYVVTVGLIFAPRLVTGSQVTGRYILAAYPPLVYGVARLPAVRRVLTERGWTYAATYFAGIGIAGQFVFLYFYHVDASLGEASQIHGTLGFVTAVLVAAWILLDAAGVQRDDLGAVALGLAAASGTVFVFLVTLWHFQFIGPVALPMA